MSELGNAETRNAIAAGGRRRGFVSKAETGIITFPRETFLADVWDYDAGEHLTVLAPSGGGKTQIAFQLLGVTANPKLPATILVMKPRDETVERFAKVHHYRIVRDWPPAQVKIVDRYFNGKPSGYVLWPPETGSPDLDDERHERIFRRCLQMMYNAGGKKGKAHQDAIIFADETYSLEHELGMTRDLNRLWTKARSLGVGLWAASQRPVFISRWALQAQHLFLGFDPDRKMQERYGEIGGGIDPDIVRSLVAQLKQFQFLYIHRDDRTMCIVDA